VKKKKTNRLEYMSDLDPTSVFPSKPHTLKEMSGGRGRGEQGKPRSVTFQEHNLCVILCMKDVVITRNQNYFSMTQVTVISHFKIHPTPVAPHPPLHVLVSGYEPMC
jgi:hypothetical protein